MRDAKIKLAQLAKLYLSLLRVKKIKLMQDQKI
jgi:hypothetical protein